MKNLFKGLIMSLGMFSIVPVPPVWDEEARPWVIPLLPLVGLVPGGLAAGAAWLVGKANLPRLLAAVLVLLVWHVSSGFIHVDGLMDTSDAVFSRASLEKRLAILKDSHVGSFAVIALIVVLLLQFSAFDTILTRPLTLILWLGVPILARLSTSLAVLLTPKTITEGYAQQFRSPQKQKKFLVPVLIGILILCLATFAGGWTILVTLLTLLVTAGIAWFCLYRAFGGISGDLAGFILVVSETAALLAWAILPEVWIR